MREFFFQEERRAQLTKYASAFGKTSMSLASPVSFPSVSQHSGQNIAQPRMMMMQVQWGSEYRMPENCCSVFRWFLQPLLKYDHLNPSSLDCFINKQLFIFKYKQSKLAQTVKWFEIWRAVVFFWLVSFLGWVNEGMKRTVPYKCKNEYKQVATCIYKLLATSTRKDKQVCNPLTTCCLRD